MRLRFISFLLAATIAVAAPMTPKEIEFLLRQETSEAEILKEARERRLLVPISPEASAILKESGATDHLLAALNQPDIVLPAGEAQAERQRQIAAAQRNLQAVQEDQAHAAARLQREAAIAAGKVRAETVKNALSGNLVRLDGDQLRTADAEAITKEPRMYALYYSSMASAESRRFTPKLIEAYQRLKQQYPGKFELIWVSCDRDEFNMALHMRTLRMPWPATRFGAARQFVEQYAGGSMPWLVVIAATGDPLTENAKTKKEIEPEQIVQGLEYLLERVR
jgi:hypothetical protein